MATMTNTAEQIEIEVCDRCNGNDVVDPYRVETEDGEVITNLCRECVPAMRNEDGIVSVRDMMDTEVSDADRKAVPVPNRTIVKLGADEANVLFTWDCDDWWVESAHLIDGTELELTPDLRNRLGDKIQKAHEELRRDP